MLIAAWIAAALLLSMCAIVFIVETAFMVIVTAKQLRKLGLLEGELKGVAGFWLFIGWPCDCLFNWWRGSWMFREMPRKLTFSSRVQWHVSNPDQSKHPMKALHWAKILNVDPGHIDMEDRGE